MLDNRGAMLRVSEREPRAPFEVRDQGRAKLGIAGHMSVIRGVAHQRHEAESLLRGDAEPEMLV
ncbi:MAG: hypothetical protein QOH28_307, partial [Actinomycetota bacterium]|nr:hypothetical protein [Actinomycetota bacterium]